MGGFDWKEIVIVTVHHQHRDSNVRRKVEGLDLRKRSLKLKALTDENRRLDAMVYSEHDGGESRAPTEPVAAEFVWTKIIPRLKVVERAAKVLLLGGDEIAV